jgi:hypothetical protein
MSQHRQRRIPMRKGKQLELWNRYVDLLKPAGELIAGTWAPGNPQVQAELCRQLAMNLSQGYFLHCQSDANHPDWAPFENSVFLLQPNPDAVYYYAPVSGDGTYRIVGERGNAPVVGFATGKVMIGMGDPPGPGFNNYDVDNLKLGADGSFEVIFGDKRPTNRLHRQLALPASGRPFHSLAAVLLRLGSRAGCALGHRAARLAPAQACPHPRSH